MDGFARVMESGRYSLGSEVEQFEKSFAAYCGSKHAIAVNSGTSAIVVALKALGIGEGDEVIVPGMTFVATATAVRETRAVPVIIDVDPNTFCLDPNHLDAALTPATKAVLPVHLYGRLSDMSAINQFADAHGLAVVEDAAQAHGAKRDGVLAGAFGDVGCFSFYPAKNLGAFGEGGAITTNDDEVAQNARWIRDWGQVEKGRYQLEGSNYRMDALQGMVLALKLPLLNDWNEARRARAATYADRLNGVGLDLAVASPDHVYHLESAFHPERDEIRNRLSRKGIETGIHYPLALHQQPGLVGWRLGSALPVAERLALEQFSLPMYPSMSDDQVVTVCNAVRAILADLSK